MLVLGLSSVQRCRSGGVCGRSHGDTPGLTRPGHAGQTRWAGDTLATMNALDALRQHRAKEREAKRLRDRLADERETLVKTAFDEGHSGPEVAAAAGISKERAYQIRDGRRR